MPDLFKDILADNESLFRDEIALDNEFLPKEIPHRENQQHYIADCIKPLFSKRNGKNLLITGQPGIGKTAAVRWVFREMEEKGLNEQVVPVYVNCWKKDTPYKIALDICEQVGFTFVHNRDTNDLFKEIAKIINKKAAVICFDECDKVQDQQLFYTILNDLFRKTLIFITNENEWITTIDKRIASRLLAEIIEFKPYTHQETQSIIKQRVDYAFVPRVINDEALNIIVDKTHDSRDIRTGLYLLREAGTIAEQRASRTITKEHAEHAINKLSDFHTKSTTQLDTDETILLNLVKEHSGKTTKQLYNTYKERGCDTSYSSFRRKIQHLSKNKFVSLERINKGEAGLSTRVHYGNKNHHY